MEKKQNVNTVMAENLNIAHYPRLKTCVWKLGLPPSSNETGEQTTYSNEPITKS
jgi:hypothetical protein